MAKKNRRGKRRSARNWAKESKGSSQSSCYSVPDGVELFEAKEKGNKRLVILPYIVGKGNPFADQGEEHFERTFWIHKDLGPNKRWLTCPRKVAGQSCPVCEYHDKISKDPSIDDDTKAALRPKKRIMVAVLDLGDDPNQIRLWEIADWYLGKLLRTKLENADEDEIDDYENFFDPDDGMTLKVTFGDPDVGKGVIPIDMEFKARKKAIPSKIVDAVPCLDDLIDVPSYEKIEKVFMADDDDHDDEPKKDPPPKAKVKEDPEPEEEVKESPAAEGDVDIDSMNRKALKQFIKDEELDESLLAIVKLSEMREKVKEELGLDEAPPAVEDEPEEAEPESTPDPEPEVKDDDDDWGDWD